jgi:predicted transcriptional regulator
MASVETITRDEILDALAQAFTSDAPEGAKTVNELAAETGKSALTVRKGLQTYQQQGRLKRFAVKRESIDGLLRPTTAYLVTKAKRK